MKLRLLKTFLYLTISSSLSTILVYPAVAAETSQEFRVACNEQLANAAKAEFVRLRDLREADPKAVSITDFKVVATKHVKYAQICYEEKYGTVSDSSIKIDDGGVWLDNISGDFAVAQFVTYGTKWGVGSSFSSGLDVAGPGLPGGVVTYSFMANGVDNSSENASPNVAISNLPTYAPCFLTEIKDSFDAWSAVANITFTEVVDDGLPFDQGNSGNIRIGAHVFDGPGPNTLAHGFYPPPNGITAAGDIHFDQEELWACVGSGANIDIGIVALHEIGHAIGLKHEIPENATSPAALMNPFYNPAVDILQPDDITGIESIYGDIVLPTCNMNTTQLSYSSGEMIDISAFSISNPTESSVAVEWKVWLTPPALDPLELVNTGANGMLELSANFETDYAVIPIAEATGIPLGTYVLGCRLLNPVTGALLYEDLHSFEVVL